jgi:DNA replication protein DnaC
MGEISYKTETFVCPKHGEYTGEMTHYLYPAEDIPSPCPVCLREAEEETRRKTEIKKWRSMNIDEKYDKAGFDTFNAYNEELKRHLATCRSFAENPDGKLVMIGTNGNGKTHLAVCVLKKLGGVIYTAFEIGANLRKSYGYNSDTKEHEVYEELCSVPLLVIDEVEKIKDSESKQNWMSHVIGKRYNRMLPLIIIANCHTQKDCMEQKKPCPRCLEWHLESDVISRITEDGHIMKFGSADYRKKIRDEKFSRGSA